MPMSSDHNLGCLIEAPAPEIRTQGEPVADAGPLDQARAKRIAELEEALRRFTPHARVSFSDDTLCTIRVYARDLRRALAVLEEAPAAPRSASPVTVEGVADIEKLRRLCGLLDDLCAWDHSKNLLAAVMTLEAAR